MCVIGCRGHALHGASCNQQPDRGRLLVLVCLRPSRPHMPALPLAMLQLTPHPIPPPHLSPASPLLPLPLLLPLCQVPMFGASALRVTYLKILERRMGAAYQVGWTCRGWCRACACAALLAQAALACCPSPSPPPPPPPPPSPHVHAQQHASAYPSAGAATLTSTALLALLAPCTGRRWRSGCASSARAATSWSGHEAPSGALVVVYAAPSWWCTTHRACASSRLQRGVQRQRQSGHAPAAAPVAGLQEWQRVVRT